MSCQCHECQIRTKINQVDCSQSSAENKQNLHRKSIEPVKFWKPTLNIPALKSYEEQAIDAVVGVLNRAKEALGERQTLKDLASSRKDFFPPAKVALTSLKCPLVITSEALIRNTIEKKWKLTESFMYVLKYIDSSRDECSQYYYFEAVFSQPIPAFPIPQATASVFFRIEDKQIKSQEINGMPKVTFRVEGHRVDHDIRYVVLAAEWLLAVIQTKIKLFRRIEQMQIF
ncbi:uncharacterized protein LOC123875830 [Maniola jurtina]|uniref:uncharacterized protein LOC123875830 n=1 Tax=Maniola jurtina TaxID=191418 RepID=UPI001E68DA0C|nr:uncharacterized protein LOC123875830 [Maniola jurtina]